MKALKIFGWIMLIIFWLWTLFVPQTQDPIFNTIKRICFFVMIFLGILLFTKVNNK